MIDVGSTVGNYVVRSKIGEGGMGSVYMAEHPLIGRRVAIKAIHAEYARNPEAVSRFFTEAQAVNKIGHPNIIDVTDFGQSPDGDCYFIMEFLQGDSLAGRLKRGRMTLAEVLQICAQISDALAASHGMGILHRDLKPDNVFLVQRGHERNFVKVLDFGLAKLTGGDQDKVSHKTKIGAVMGTPYYMAPEQCQGRPDIDGRADIYALGIMIFEMLTGKVPFTGDGYGEIIVKHITTPAPRASSLNPDLPPWLDEMVARCLEKERNNRIQSMAELRDYMTQGMASVPEAATMMAQWSPSLGSRPPTMPPPGSRPGYASQPAFQSRPAYQSSPVYPGPGSKPPSVNPNAPISTLGMAAGATSTRPPSGGSKKPLAIIAGVLVAGGIVAALVIAMGGSKSPPAAASQPELTPTDPTTKPATTEPTTDPTATKPTTDPATDPAATRPTAPAEVVVSLESEPGGAKVVLADGTVLGTTPFVWKTAPSDAAVELSFHLDKYETKRRSITPKQTQTIAVDLVKVAERPTTRPTTKPTKPTTTKPTTTKPTTTKPTTKPTKPGGDDLDDIMDPGQYGKKK